MRSTFVTPFPVTDSVHVQLPLSIMHSHEELVTIHTQMVENRFNPADFPYLVIAQPLTPYVTNLQTDEDEDARMMLKALVINYEDWVKFEKGSVIQFNIDAVADHVRGIKVDGIPQAGFLKHKDQLDGN